MKGVVPAAFPAAVPARSWTPLALTLGLHLLLVLAWLGAAPRGGMREAAQRVATLVLVQPPALPRPRPQAQPKQRVAPPRAPAIAPVRVPAPLPDVSLSVPSEPAEAAPPAAAPGPLPGDLLAAAKRMAGPADRELRKGASPISAEPERKWERFAEAIAAAHTGAIRDTRLDSHTAADGVVTYRKTVGNRVRCYRGGGVGGLGPADGRSAGSVPCPTGVDWTRL